MELVRPGRNLGFGAGVNRGLAALAGDPAPPEWVLVCNPDLVVHPGALTALRQALESEPAWALVGPRIFTETGEVYPSVRNFPSFTDAAGHALLALFNPQNPYTLRYNPGTPPGDVVAPAGWVSGSCFLARRSALEELGGFDEAYFMYLEDTDLCWRAHDAGWGVGFAGTAEVTHVQGFSTARHPYRMMVPTTARPSASLSGRPRVGAVPPSRWRCWSWRPAWASPPSASPSATSALGGHRPLLIIAIVAIAITVLALVVAALVSGPRSEGDPPCACGAAGDVRPPAAGFGLQRRDGATRWRREGAADGERGGRAGGRDGRRVHRRPGAVPVHPRHRGRAVDH